jgi:hypothetical protein
VNNGRKIRYLRQLVLSALGLIGFVSSLGCVSTTTRAIESTVIRGDGAPVTYNYPTPEGQVLSTKDLLGRDTALLFITTYDAVSLAAVRRLIDLWHVRKPRFNILLVVLEPPQNSPLVAVFRDSLQANISVVLADQQTLDGQGAFGDVRIVPGVVLLDRDAKIVIRGFGTEAYRLVEERLRDSSH